jgi:hypothetical protein
VGNKCKKGRIPRTESLLIAVQNVVNQHYLYKERVICQQIFDFVIKEKQVSIDIGASGQFEVKAFNLVYCAVHNWVKNCSGYRQSRQVGNFLPKKENIAKKHYYLRQVFENCAL